MGEADEEVSHGVELGRTTVETVDLLGYTPPELKVGTGGADDEEAGLLTEG